MNPPSKTPDHRQPKCLKKGDMSRGPNSFPSSVKGHWPTISPESLNSRIDLPFASPSKTRLSPATIDEIISGFDPCRQHPLSICKCPKCLPPTRLFLPSVTLRNRDTISEMSPANVLSLEEQTIGRAAQKTPLPPTAVHRRHPHFWRRLSTNVARCGARLSPSLKGLLSLLEGVAPFPLQFRCCLSHIGGAAFLLPFQTSSLTDSGRGGHVLLVTCVTQTDGAPLAEGVLRLSVLSTAVCHDDPDGINP
ncbi:unnamed protein product [Acanthosepion pharaonis]|uniref:Uncharacterized protein n=1 Tax=Acanthosepion pharaonis TaxID=158019 RepID=A0A812CDI4_ACAPH|nr:unnamed protein product [Sepia pharaonis]